MKRTLQGVLAALIYFLIVFAPVIVMIIAPARPGREFWREFSVAIGFIGISLLGLQFVPTARLPKLAEIFPLDALYYFHHLVSLVAFFFALAHPIILFIYNPFTLRLLNVFVSPWRARAAVIAVVALFVIVISSVWRKQLEQAYEPWRIVHRLLSLIIVAFVLWHMVGVNYHMSVPAQRGVWIGMVALWVLTVAYVRIVKPIQMMQRPYHVTDVIEERGQSWTLVLEPDGHDGMDFMPGQFAWITIGEKPFHISEHPFSIASSAERPRNIEFTIRELGDFTSQIKYTEPGTEVYIDGPHSTFSIDRFEAPAYVFIAGGVGIVPIMSMLRTMADRGDDRPVLLMYGSLNWESIIYREELEEIEGRMNLTVVHVLEKPAEEWEGESGYINADVLDRHMPGNRDAMQYFICGPIPMIEAVEKALGQLDVSMTRMHSELYEMA